MFYLFFTGSWNKDLTYALRKGTHRLHLFPRSVVMMWPVKTLLQKATWYERASLLIMNFNLGDYSRLLRNQQFVSALSFKNSVEVKSFPYDEKIN